MNTTKSAPARQAKRSAPPLPGEHGAWAMLYTPWLSVLIAAPQVDAWAFALIFVAVTSLFIGQNALFVVLRSRRRGQPEAVGWLVGCALAAAGSGLGLLVGYGLTELLWLALAASVMLGAYAAARLQRKRKRLHRQFVFELLTVGAIALTGPAAVVAATGELGRLAWLVWVGWWAYFASSVFVVRMLIDAARTKTVEGLRAPVVVYHVAFTGALAAAAVALEWALAGPLVAACAPVAVRGFLAAATVKPVKPALVKLGFVELALTTWALAWSVPAIQAL